MAATVIAVASDTAHNFSKPPQDVITLVTGKGVQGDAHFGETVQHLSDKRKNPKAVNLRQVHLMHSELFTDLSEQGISVIPGQMGENITTQGLDILNLPLGTVLQIGAQAKIEITGLRNPCFKLNAIHPGLLKAVAKADKGGALRKSGIMSIVLKDGPVKAGDLIKVTLPPTPHIALKGL